MKEPKLIIRVNGDVDAKTMNDFSNKFETHMKNNKNIIIGGDIEIYQLINGEWKPITSSIKKKRWGSFLKLEEKMKLFKKKKLIDFSVKDLESIADALNSTESYTKRELIIELRNYIAGRRDEEKRRK